MNRLFYIVILLVIAPFTLWSQADFRVEGLPCLGSTLNFYNQSLVVADSVLWEFDENNDTSIIENPSYTYSDTGMYNVKLTIYSGLSSFAKIKAVTIHNNPVAAFNIDTVLQTSYERVFSDTSITDSPLDKFIWVFDDVSDTLATDSSIVTHLYPDAGSYNPWLKVIDIYGCSDSTSNAVSVVDLFRVPNVFTPNGDTKNDELTITTNGINHFSIYIYSRSGHLVFKREGFEQIVWDGTMANGEVVAIGTYYYIISVLDGNTNYKPETGFISVFY